MAGKRKNLIIRFDEDKVSIQDDGYHTVWYDITDIAKSHIKECGSSVMEYVVKYRS